VRALLAIAFASAGCIDSFAGSNVQFDFAPSMFVQASPGMTPTATQLPSDIHFTFYAIENDAMASRLFAVQQFEIHRIVDLNSPCYIDVGDHVPFPGLHVSQYAKMIEMQTGIADPANPPAGATEAQKIDVATAVTRMTNVGLLASDAGIAVISSASAANYPPVATDCIGPGIPPATCTDDASNARRLQMCQQFWHDNPGYFEGTDRVLTEPLAGTTHGFVDGTNPINFAPVGGAQFFANTDLGGITDYALYYQHDGMPDPGTLLMYGTATTPTRGVLHVHMANPAVPTASADVAIFTNLDDDSTNF
jgi:hypothetical protein